MNGCIIWPEKLSVVVVLPSASVLVYIVIHSLSDFLLLFYDLLRMYIIPSDIFLGTSPEVVHCCLLNIEYFENLCNIVEISFAT